MQPKENIEIQNKDSSFEIYKLSSKKSKSLNEFNEDENKEMYEKTIYDVVNSKS